jgi:hypothetical protein
VRCWKTCDRTLRRSHALLKDLRSTPSTAPADRYKHERCVVGDPAAPANGDINAASTWELQRVGPFNTTGGKDWSTAMSKWLMCKYCQSRGGADGGLPGGYDANCEQLNVPNGTNCSAADNVEQMDWLACGARTRDRRCCGGGCCSCAATPSGCRMATEAASSSRATQGLRARCGRILSFE